MQFVRKSGPPRRPSRRRQCRLRAEPELSSDRRQVVGAAARRGVHGDARPRAIPEHPAAVHAASSSRPEPPVFFALTCYSRVNKLCPYSRRANEGHNNSTSASATGAAGAVALGVRKHVGARSPPHTAPVLRCARGIRFTSPSAFVASSAACETMLGPLSFAGRSSPAVTRTGFASSIGPSRETISI